MTARIDNYQILVERMPDGLFRARVVGGVVSSSSNLVRAWHTEAQSATSDRPEIAVATALGLVDRAFKAKPGPAGPKSAG